MSFFKPAADQPRLGGAAESEEKDIEIRARLATALNQIRASQSSIEFKGLASIQIDGQVVKRTAIIREIEMAGYRVTFPYRDMGLTACISW